MKTFGLIVSLLLSFASTAQKLKVSVSNSPPLAYFEEGTPKGLFVDILNTIAEEENWQLQYEEVAFSTGLNQLRSGSTDIFVNLARTPEREAFASFNAVSVYSTFGQLFSKNESIETIPDLVGMRVGYLNNDFYAMEPEDGLLKMIEHSAISVELLPFNSYDDITTYLEDDMLDAGVFSRPYGYSRFLTNDLFEFEEVIAAPLIFAPTSLHFAFPTSANYTDISETIDAYIIRFRKDKNSVYYSSLRSNLLTRETPYIPDWMYLLVVLSLSGMTIFYLFNNLLSTRVKIKTKEIRAATKDIQESNQKLSLALNAVKEGVWEWNLKTNKISIDKHSFNILGYQMAGEQTTWEELLSIINADDQVRFEKSFQDHFNDKSTFHEVTFRAKDKNGEDRWLYIHGSVVEVDNNGNPARYLGTMVDIHEKKTLEEQLEESETKEREKISRELHDGVQQELSAAVLNLNYVLADAQIPEKSISKISVGIDNVNNSIKEIRNLAHELDFNLAPAVEGLVESINSVTTTDISFISNLGSDRVDHKVEKAIFRVVQEAVNNIIKHAGATKATIQLMKYPDLIILTIEDDGKGFDSKGVASSFGLKSMKSRASHVDGQISIDSTPGKGTAITLEIPIQ